MKIVHSIEELTESLTSVRKEGRSIGFVPTMGALHEGHMALIRRAGKESDFVVATVYVNPTQFNNQNDLKLYPRTPENDARLLEENGCDLLFFPTTEEMYPAGFTTPNVPLGNLEKLMEGAFRPGHFNGVIQIVYRFFDLIQPDKAFFGLKDFQQVAVIQHMVNYLELPVKIVPCPTLRETTGLAMSSRNMRLNDADKAAALHIFKTLTFCKENVENYSPKALHHEAVSFFNQGALKLEYLSIVDPVTLEDLTDSWVPGATVCIACFCGDVRLIDNLTIVPYE